MAIHTRAAPQASSNTHLTFVLLGGWYGLRGSMGPPTNASPAVVLLMNGRSFGSHFTVAREAAGGGCVNNTQTSSSVTTRQAISATSHVSMHTSTFTSTALHQHTPNHARHGDMDGSWHDMTMSATYVVAWERLA